MNRLQLKVTICLLAGIATLFSGCGGGGGSSTAPTNPPPPPPPVAQPLAITTSSMPPAMQGHAYSATLAASGGTAPFKWSSNLGGGLSLDVNTGAVTGMPTFTSQISFIATVTDSSTPVQTVSRQLFILGLPPLTVPATLSKSVYKSNPVEGAINASGGLPPYVFAVTSGSLPPGVSIHSAGFFSGYANDIGTFKATVQVRDSFSPANLATTEVTLVVSMMPLTFQSYGLPNGAVAQPYFGMLKSYGGIAPYAFSITQGSLPPGLSLDGASGRITGTPATAGTSIFTATVSDSENPPKSVDGRENINVAVVRPRNDTLANATFIVGGASASISPYSEPRPDAPYAADQDYYKIISLGGSVVHITVSPQTLENPLDSVIEIVDSNGQRLTSCRQPGDTSTSYTSDCINDDIDATTHGSAIDIKMPGAGNVASTVYIHVFDWRGDARPDMAYSLRLDGWIDPLKITTESILAAIRGVPYRAELGAYSGTAPYKWSISSGTLPPGLSLSSAGVISGTPTTDGSYTFTVQVQDSVDPPQTASATFTIGVGEPLQILSPATWPEGCVGKPYSFQLQKSGGTAPFNWSLSSYNWPSSPTLARTTGLVSGVPNAAGTSYGQLTLADASGTWTTQTIFLTVRQCP